MQNTDYFKFLALLILGIVIGGLYFDAKEINLIKNTNDQNKIIPPPPPDNPEAPTKPLEGTIKTGEQINRDYCSNGYYLDLKAETKMYLLRDVDSEEMLELPKYLDEEVRVIVKNETEPRAYCAALLCNCEESLYVIKIEELN